MILWTFLYLCIYRNYSSSRSEIVKSMLTAIRFLPSVSFYAWIFHLISLSFSVSLPLRLDEVNANLCNSLCQCTSKTVDCNHQDVLSFIPTDIREDFDQLHISHAEFRDCRLTKNNFSSIIHLTSLRIVYSKLQSISDNTFSLMDRLQYMDLSHNNFSIIGFRAFSGLSLTNLYLEQNLGGLQLLPNMFTGLHVTNLYLKSNRISTLAVSIIENLKIVKLYLFNNSIKSLDRKFEKFFYSEDSLLDLTKNPLDCSCGLSWFADMIKRWKNVQPFVKLTCHSPSQLANKTISDLKRDDFFCETPSINKISVDISENHLQLICHANGGIRPKISWKQINQHNGVETETALYEDLRIFEHFSYISLNVTKLDSDNSFLCTTWNQAEYTNQVLVKLKVNDNLFGMMNKEKRIFDRKPPEQIDPKLNNNNPQITPETHFLFRKQFSILQMIGAVVGTFTSVIVLIFIICCSQGHFVKKNSNSNPYWTIIPTEMKYPSNRMMTKSPASPNVVMATSVNSQDYDVPQYPESNTFLHNFYTERNVPHYVDVKPNSYFTTVT